MTQPKDPIRDTRHHELYKTMRAVDSGQARSYVSRLELLASPNSCRSKKPSKSVWRPAFAASPSARHESAGRTVHECKRVSQRVV